MAYAVRWSPEAVEDVESIAAWISRDSPRHAGAVVDRFMAAAASLDVHPLRGRIVPELNDPGYRELFVQSFRVIYKLEDETVVVLAVIHGRRLLESSLSRFDG